MIDFSNITEGYEAHANVLGTDYKIVFSTNVEQYPLLEDADAYCDQTSKFILVRYNWDDASLSKISWLIKKNLRHELYHAFLDESGLGFNSCKSNKWAVNEEMVDWLAIQFPKINKLFIELGIDEE